MFNDFGNVNDMTKGQFNTALEYYRNKVKMMTEDTSISEESKAWFLERYNERIRSLETTLSELETSINAAKNSGTLVNDETTTLSRLGRTSTANDNFNQLAQDANRHRVSQRWKIIGACLLPVVGTIPFLISWRRARKDITKSTQDSLKKILNLAILLTMKEDRMKKTLLTSTKFTEAEMANLLEDTTELARIEALALTGTISPIERTNLTKKLVEVREFGQKNGYTMTGILTNPAFRTKADKTETQITAHEGTYNGTPATATNLKAAYDAIKTLENLRAEVQSLYNETKNTRLETLLNNIDSRLTTLRGNAKTSITAGVNAVVASVNAVTAATTDEAGYTAAINSVEAAAVAANAHFGTGINAEQARRMAEEIGFDDQTEENIKFNEIENARANKKSGFEADLNKVKSEAEFRQNVANNLTELDRVLTHKLDPLSPIDEVNIKEAFIYFAEAKSAYDFLNQNIANLSTAEKGTFDALRTRYLAHESTLNTKNQEFASKAENFDSYKTEITTRVDDTKTKSVLKGELVRLKGTLAVLKSAEYKEKNEKIGLESELSMLISDADEKVTQYEDIIKQKEEQEENTKHNETVKNTLTYNESIFNTISGATSTDLVDLEYYETTLKDIVAALKDITIDKLDDTNKSNLLTLRDKVNKKLLEIQKKIRDIKAPEKAEAEIIKDIDTTKKIALSLISQLATAKSADKKSSIIASLSLCAAALQDIKDKAARKGVVINIDALIVSINETIANNPLGPTAP